MPPRFLPGVKQPKAYPLGILGPHEFDPSYFSFVRKKINLEVMFLSNVEILTLGIKVKLNYNTWGGLEEIASQYAKRYWYTVRFYRNLDKFYKMDKDFLKDAKGFILFDDGNVTFYKAFIRDSGKPFKIFKLPEMKDG